MIDYPAAHSMDTEWFAVDADGNIAVFSSGEGGAVPRANYQIWSDARDKWGSDIQIDYFEELLTAWSKDSSDRIIDFKIPSEAIMAGLGLKVEDLDIDRIDIKTLDSTFTPLPRLNERIIEDEDADDDEIVD